MKVRLEIISTPVALMPSIDIGVLAEDENDCDVISALIRRILAEKQITPNQFKVRKRAGKGCSKLRRKAEPWIRELAERGCRQIVMLHDLDRNDEVQLRSELNSLTIPNGMRRLVCIPAEEIEAWFFSSPRVLFDVSGGRGSAQVHHSPHLISSPKEKLIALSRGANRKPRYSPNDNTKLAEELELDLCAQRCQAFRELREFVRGLA